MSRHRAPDPAEHTDPTTASTPAPSVDPHVVAGLHTRVAALEAWRAHQTDLLDELLDNVHDPADDELGDSPDDEPTTDDLDDDALIEWVHRHVAAVIARPLRGEHKWCPQWWEHPEAIFRFTALHRAWTELAGEPGSALSIWIRDHLDPCLRELLAPAGPFTDCTHSERHRSRDAHTSLPTLPTARPAEHHNPAR